MAMDRRSAASTAGWVAPVAACGRAAIGRSAVATVAAVVAMPVAACLLLLAVYGALASLNHPSGLLGSDSGGKVATLEAMADRGRLDPDLGYWAEQLDPDGRAHPLVLTRRLGERWVNVTTLPMLYAAYPLYRLGGYRLALLLPMAGGVLCALAARALARRLAGGTGWAAFWIVGAASPVLVYALDFWEHTWGLAATAWAVVLLWDVVEKRGGVRAATVAGALFGAAATLRTEALAYGAVAVALAGLALLRRGRGPRAALATGVAAVVGLAGPLVANHALEVATLGQSLRSGRAADAAVDAAGGMGDALLRAHEALTGGVGLFSTMDLPALVLGAALVAMLALVVAHLAGHRSVSPAAARLAAVGVAGLYLARFALGPGVVPGLATAAPLTVAGLVLGRRNPRARYPLAVALVALPVVWATQYPGAALSHVGARYSLLSGLLLTSVAVAELPRLRPFARRALVGLAAAVTAFAFSFMVVRTHAFARVGAELAARDEPVLVSRFVRLGREAGAFYGPHRWLSAHGDDDQRFAVALLERAGIDRFGLVLPPGQQVAPIAGWRQAGVDRLALLPGFDLLVATYDRA